MKRTKIFVLLLIAVFIHFGLTFAVVVGRLSCDVQVHCISRLNEVAGAVLSFPLGLVVWVMQYVGLDPDVVTGAIWGGDIFVLCVVNSLLAVIIVWYALIKPITRRRKKAPASWNVAIENRWSGVFGDVNVTTMVTSGNAMDVDTNVITMIAAGTRSVVNFWPSGGKQDTGAWAIDASGNVVSHEAGHLLRLPDRYHDIPDPNNPWGKRSIPDPGYENNIMGNVRMRPSEADFFRIMNDKLICH